MPAPNRSLVMKRWAPISAMICAVFLAACDGAALGQFDPFGDPFGPPRPRDPNQEYRQEAQMIIVQAERIGHVLVKRMHESDDDGLLLEGALSSLYARRADEGGELFSFEMLGALARRNWRKTDDQTSHDYVKRLTDEVAARETGEAAKLFEAAEKYKSISGRDWHYDWREKPQPWLDLISTLIDARDADDPSRTWSELASKHPEFTDLYRTAYLASMDGRQRAEIDLEFVSPLLDDALPPDRRIVYLAATLRVLATCGEAADAERRASLRSDLVELAQQRANFSTSYEALAMLYTTPRAQSERMEIQRVLLEHAQPEMFTRFARQANFGDPVLRRLFLGKQVYIDLRETPRCAVIEALEDKVDLPLWIDPAVREDAATVTVSHGGRWIDVMLAVLDDSPHELLMLRDDVMWIGPSSRRDAASALVRNAAGKVPDHTDLGARRLSEGLHEPTELDFRETPLGDVCEYLSDFHNLPIAAPRGDLRFKPITLDLRNVPLHLALELACQQTGADWAVVGTIAVVRSPDDLAASRRGYEDFRVQLARLEAADAPILVKLREESHFEFIECPLVDLFAYLNDLHAGLPYELQDGVSPDLPITFAQGGAPLGSMLPTMLLDHGLDLRFDDDGTKLIIGRHGN